jgi:osmotically-inducible protein OsmY
MAGMRESGGARLINGAYPLQSGSAAAGSPPDNQAQSANSAPSGASTMNGRANGSDNSTVQAQIENAIHNDPALGNSHVSILVSDTAIDMSGTVPTSKDRVSATRIAQSFGANRKIVNDKLMVTGHGHSDMPPPHPAMDSSGTSDNTQQNQSGNTTPHR